MGENTTDDNAFYNYLRANLVKIAVILTFFGGQYYLIEYRLSQVESAVSENNQEIIQEVNANAISIQNNTKRIHSIEVTRAGEISQITETLEGIQNQLETIMKAYERQADQIEFFLKQGNSE